MYATTTTSALIGKVIETKMNKARIIFFMRAPAFGVLVRRLNLKLSRPLAQRARLLGHTA
jgi:hypothetical protein